MNLKRKIFSFFAIFLTLLGTTPMNFLAAMAEEPAGDVPKTLKTLKTNNDGTYDITLEVEGVSSQKTDATKANVVVVFDSSGSMDNKATTYAYTEDTTGRFRKENGDYLNLYRYSSWYGCYRMDSDNSTTNVYSDSSCSTRYTGTRYTRTTVNGTRLSVAKTAVNVLANELLSQNDSSTPGFEDVVEMAFVDFATNVNSIKGPTTSLDTFKGWVNGTNVSTGNNAGTNWEAALAAAKGVSFGDGDNDKTYIIFVSDGNPTFRDSKYNNNANDCRTDLGFRCPPDPWGQGGSDNNGWNLGAAQVVAGTITAEGGNKELYAVGTFGEAGNMKKLGGTYYDATNQDALEAAFADIVNKINMGLSVTDLKIEDGITTSASSEVKGTVGHFRYNVPESWGDDYEKATFDGASVHWNPGHDKTLSNGEKASVTFTVWPSQEAMDCIAAIRNGEGCDRNLAEFGLAQNSNGSYRLLTNTAATFTYRTRTNTDGVITDSAESARQTIPERRDDTTLPETKLAVTKLWADGMQITQRTDEYGDGITLKLSVDGEEVRTYKFTGTAEGSEWANGYTYTIAPGVMKKLTGPETDGIRASAKKIVTVDGVEYAVLETGRDYDFVETPDSAHYELTKKHFHPMIVGEGGKIHDVIFHDDGTAEIDEVELTKLSAENTLNGGIVVSKEVINNGQVDETIDDEYTIKVNLSVNDGMYRILHADGTRSDDIAFTGGVITTVIKQSDQILVKDLKDGTTFTVSEVLPKGYVKNEISYELIDYNNNGATTSGASAQIVHGNMSSTAKVTNYLNTGNIVVSKEVTARSGNLTKAQEKSFSFTVKIFEKQGDVNPWKTETFELKHGETKTIKNVPAGFYYEIVEDGKPGFNGGREMLKNGTVVTGANKVEFKNDYAVTKLTDDEAKILVDKAFAGGYEPFWIASDEFTFVMTGNGETIESKPLTLSGRTAEFVPEILDAGTYVYTITEKTSDASGKSLFRDGVSRFDNDEDIVVTIVVEDKGDGTLGLVSKTYSKASKTIYNKYEGDNTYGGKSGELEFTKNLIGRDWRDSDKFNFTISSKDENAPMPEKTTITADKEHKTIGFGKIKFTNKNVGKTYTYTITESFDAPSVEAVGSTAGGISLTIAVSYNQSTGKIDLTVSDYETTFTNEYKTTDLTVAKVWNDDGDRDDLRKNYADYFVAVKDDNGKIVAYEKLALEDKDNYVFTDLPEKNAEGKRIEYTIVEASTCSGKGEAIKCTEYRSDKNYTAIVEGNRITNKHEPELINEEDDDPDNDGKITVQKVWTGEGNELARPNAITVELYANGKRLGAPVTLTAAGGWKYTFEGLYKNENGKPIAYSVEESKLGETAFGENESTILVYSGNDAISGSWTKSVNGHEITNTWKEATDEIIYDGANRFYIKKVDEEYRPLEGVTFSVNGSDKITNAEGMTSKSVPVSMDQKEESFEFTISEKATLDGYDLVNDSAKLTVTCNSILSNVDSDKLVNTYTKTCSFAKSGSDKYAWDEDSKTLTVINNRSLARSLVIRKEIAGVTGQELRDNGLKFIVTGPEDFKEQEIKFSQFTKVQDGVYEYAITGKIPTGNYKVVETGAGFDELLTLTVSGDDNREKKVAKDDAATFTIKNTYEKIRDVHYKVAKEWIDDGNRDGIRPENLKITLLRNGEVYGKPIELSGDDWVYEWTNLPRADESAKMYEYSVVEEAVKGYESDGRKMTDGTFTFVNTHEPELIHEDDDDPNNDGKITVQKIWEGEGNELVRPSTVMVELHASTINDKGEVKSWVEGQPVELSAANDWKWTFEHLFRYDNGLEITYTVKESKLGEMAFDEGDNTIIVYRDDIEIENGKWEKVISGYNVTNTWTRSTAKSLTIRKIVSGLMAETLTDLEFTITGPEDFGEDGEMTVKLGEGCEAVGYEIVCIVEGRVPTGMYMVKENNAEVEKYTLVEVSGDNEVERKVNRDDEVVFEIKNKYEADEVDVPDDPCAEGGCGGWNVMPVMTPNTGRFTSKSDGGEATEEAEFVNYIVGTCVLIVVGAAIFIAEKRNSGRK